MQQLIPGGSGYLPLYCSYTRHFCLPKHRVTRNFDWDVIIDIANDMFIVRPIPLNNFITSIQNGRGNICFVKVELEIANFFDDISIQIEINGTFTTVTSFVFHNKKLFTVKFITNSFTCS